MIPPLHRPRRNRRTPALRDLVRETSLSSRDLVYPVFLHGDAADVEIEAMPGQTRWSPEGLLRVAERTLEAGVRALVLFPKIEDDRKDRTGSEVENEDGLVPRSLRALKARFPSSPSSPTSPWTPTAATATTASSTPTRARSSTTRRWRCSAARPWSRPAPAPT